MWSLGLIVLFLMAPLARDELPRLKSMTQDSVDISLQTIFNPDTSTSEIMSRAGQDFVRCCLKVLPSERISASRARKHDWLQLPMLSAKDHTRLLNGAWKPFHRTAPPIEDLPDLESISACQHLYLVNKKVAPATTSPEPWSIKRKASFTSFETDSESDVSPYFNALNNPAASKKTKH